MRYGEAGNRTGPPDLYPGRGLAIGSEPLSACQGGKTPIHMGKRSNFSSLISILIRIFDHKTICLTSRFGLLGVSNERRAASDAG